MIYKRDFAVHLLYELVSGKEIDSNAGVAACFACFGLQQRKAAVPVSSACDVRSASSTTLAG
jgi:hypothetical protein